MRGHGRKNSTKNEKKTKMHNNVKRTTFKDPSRRNEKTEMRIKVQNQLVSRLWYARITNNASWRPDLNIFLGLAIYELDDRTIIG